MILTSISYQKIAIVSVLSGLSSKWSANSIQLPTNFNQSYRSLSFQTAYHGDATIHACGRKAPSFGDDTSHSRLVQRYKDLRRCGATRNLVTLFQSPSPTDTTTTTTPNGEGSTTDDDNPRSISEKFNILQQENQILRSAIKDLENQNQILESQRQIVIEQFEGERLFDAVDAVEECEDKNADGTCPIDPDVSFQDAFRDRAYWLVGLLAFQSMSGFILARNELLLQSHPVIIYFLTMLVGAGGNAGNQASVRVIRGLALGKLDDDTQNQFLAREFKMALALSFVLSLAGFIRAVVFRTPLAETIAITLALTIIVFSSICLGAVLPLLLKNLKIDPAHSSTSIQVIMDILGVVLTVSVSGIILDSPTGQWLISKLLRAG